jgi:hypothetical protein
MKKIITLLVAGTLSFSVTAQQESIPMTKKQFLDTYENMLNQAEKNSETGCSRTDEVMKKNMPSEDYQKYKNQAKESEQRHNNKLAKCIGITPEKLAKAKEKFKPKAMLIVMKQCSSNIPASFSMTSLDFTKEPALADFGACTQELITKESGISAAKYATCDSELSGD